MEKMKKMAEEMRSTTEKVKEDPIKKARNENFGADETMISHDPASISNKNRGRTRLSCHRKMSQN